MKRPEGFDTDPEAESRAARDESDERAAGRGTRARRSWKRSAPSDDDSAAVPTDSAAEVDDEVEDEDEGDAELRRAVAGLPDLPSIDDDPDAVPASTRPRAARVTDVRDAKRKDAAGERRTSPIGAAVRAAETAREARLARRRRRETERSEVRRFTRRSRRRRVTWMTVTGVVVAFALAIVVGVYSPLMALRTVEIKGANRVDSSALQRALDAQVGTPLARLDFDQVKKTMASFPLVESYVTEEEPPHTLVVTITERTPIVAVKTAAGYEQVDPAGIVVTSSPKAPSDLPIADVRSTQLGSSVFKTMTKVVLALPKTVRSKMKQVTASTADDVTLTMDDGSKVVWGSPDDSKAKAALLAALVADHAKRGTTGAVEYDVSAPDNGIIRSQSK